MYNRYRSTLSRNTPCGSRPPRENGCGSKIQKSKANKSKIKSYQKQGIPENKKKSSDKQAIHRERFSFRETRAI
jgi:hypothetical protein